MTRFRSGAATMSVAVGVPFVAPLIQAGPAAPPPTIAAGDPQCTRL